MRTFNNDLKTALVAARAGAEVAANRFGQTLNTRIKVSSHTLVTDADLETEEAILNVLKGRSDYRIMSEESGLSAEGEGPVWIVDPIDGTSNFAHSLPFFAVSVALYEKNSGLTGVIIDPVSKTEYSASKDNGVFCNGKPLVIKDYNPQSVTLFVNHGHNSRDKELYSILTSRFAGKYGIRKLGTTALELCYVACGFADGFICHGDEIWDFAAGVIIASEAGCEFTDWQGMPWDGKSRYVLVARPEIKEELIKMIRDL